MVRIISKGRVYCECPKCHSLLEADYTDFYYVQEAYNEYKKYAKCPSCQYKIEESYWKKF